MSEQERMDNLLRSAMAAEPIPRLSPSFDRRLAQRIAPGRLKPQARLIMILYAVVALLISVWALRDMPLSTEFLLGAVFVLVPVSYGWTLYKTGTPRGFWPGASQNE